MKFFTDPNHPNARDMPQGTTVYHGDADDTIIILMWRAYSPSEGEYDATLARFSIDKKKSVLRLQHVSIKRKYSSWNATLTNPAHFVTDRMKRAVRKFMFQETDVDYWRVKV